MSKEIKEPKCKVCGDSGVKKPEKGCGKCLSIDGNCRADCPCPDCQAPEQPNCEGCEFFKHTYSNEHCYRYTEEPSLCKLRQEPVEQPPAGELMKEAIELSKMCVSEIVAKYESSHNAIAVLKRKFREACESDEWMKSATEFYELGGCPICFSTDEAGCTEGCYLGQLFIRLDRSEAGERILEERIEKLSDTLDRSEASRKDLLTACENLKKIYIEGSGNTSWMANYSNMDAAIKAKKEVKI